MLLLDLDFVLFWGSFFFLETPISEPLFFLLSFSTCRRIFISGLLGASLPSSSSWLAELSPLIDLLLPLLFDLSLDFLEEGLPKRISRESLPFSKRDKACGLETV
jgi:hypothetical protein